MTSQRQELIENLDRRFSSRGLRQRRLNRVFQGSAWLVWVQALHGTKRATDLGLAVILILALSPLLFILCIGGVERSPRLGRWGCAFQQLAFRRGPLRSLAALVNVLKGDMSLVGPRAVPPEEVSALDRAAWRRFNVRPGLICLWWIRKRANIAYGTESEVDSEYLDTQSVWADFGIALRAIPAVFYGEGIALAPDRIDLLGIPIDNLTMDEAIGEILSRTQTSSATQICFVNADCVNITYRDAEYRDILCNCGLVLADGIGVKLAGKILNSNIRQNVNGTDLFPQLCAAMERSGASLYLLGGKPGVGEEVAAWIRERYPALRIAGHQHGFFQAGETAAVTERIRQSSADVLLVAFGAPKQEKWIRRHLEETGARVVMGVGGLFDFYSGRIPRAPVWMRELGMEWFYRFWQEPRRMWRRYFVGNAVFLWRAVAHRVQAS